MVIQEEWVFLILEVPQKKTYEFIMLGRPAGFGSIINSMNGESDEMAR
jgi:hypothetical protein